jgi:hypothetical protein
MNRPEPNRGVVSRTHGAARAVVAAALFVMAITAAASERPVSSTFTGRSLRAQTEQYIDYYSSIRLTSAQERIKAKALQSIAAPCCKKYTMATCCCPCNLAKSVWGMSNYLISKKGYDAAAVKRAALDWLAAINPKGFTGNACFTGGCLRPFAQNGCAGMDSTRHRG